MVVQVFESIGSFESTSGVRISTVRIVPTPLFKMVTHTLSPHRSSLRKEIVNQSELYLYSPLKKAADVYANQMAIDHLNAAHKENIVRRKHHVPVHGVPSTAIIVPNYVRYDAKTSLDY